METSVAVKKLAKLLGKSFGYRVDPKAPKLEEREAAQSAMKAAVDVRNKLQQQRDDRYKAILAADAEYQKLRADCTAAINEVDRLRSITLHYRITVGTTSSIFFHVKAQGDSWEEVIRKLSPKSGAK